LALGERRLTLDLVDETQLVDDPAVRLVERDGARVELAFDPGQVSTTELISRLTARHAVRDLFVENAPIEEVIARLYETSGVELADGADRSGDAAAVVQGARSPGG
jgi:ABC-2 type transport system ATP-binding protein